MRRRCLNRWFILTVLILGIVGGNLFAQSTDRYFDTLDKKSDVVTLTILYPSRGTIGSLIGLQKEGFFPSRDIIVVGAYHEKEFTDYKASQKFADEKGLGWLKFHKIVGEIDKDNLFRKNGCTPDFEKIFSFSDGIIFFGGADIPPEIYNEKTILLTGIQTPYRHYLELSFVFHLLGGSQDEDFQPLLEVEPEFPVLGICLGEQTLNVGTGGTLFQDIWFERYGKTYLEDVVKLGRERWHNNPLRRLYPEERLLSYNMHRILLKAEGKFCSEMGFDKKDTPYIISSHHQAVQKLGLGMRVIATSLDGKVVEAIEHERFPYVLGIQFHPEFSTLWETEKKFRITLEDEKFSLRSILEENPPSYAFHRKLWAWTIEKVRKYHDAHVN